MTKGYYVSNGYYGYVEDDDHYMLFASEADYQEYVAAQEEESIYNNAVYGKDEY